VAFVRLPGRRREYADERLLLRSVGRAGGRAKERVGTPHTMLMTGVQHKERVTWSTVSLAGAVAKDELAPSLLLRPASRREGVPIARDVSAPALVPKTELFVAVVFASPGAGAKESVVSALLLNPGSSENN